MGLDDNQKIGVGLISLGIGFIFLGVILFFDAAMIAIGNILFLVGLCFSIGVKRTLSLFTRYVCIADFFLSYYYYQSVLYIF